jgi:putative protein-disulfide isomerase
MTDSLVLYYSHDPMCSFCWAFRPVWMEIRAEINQRSPQIEIRSIMGGLAADSDQPMSDAVRQTVRGAWGYIEKHIPGTQFNYEFWNLQQPRRSTYPSCRAVIAVRLLEPTLEDSMVLAIQQAYYLQAKNPSDIDTLVQCAVSISLDAARFTETLGSVKCNELFLSERALSQSLGIAGFPNLVLSHGEKRFNIPVDYLHASRVLDSLYQAAALL